MFRDFNKEIDEFPKNMPFDDTTVPMAFFKKIIQRNFRFGHFRFVMLQLRTGLIDPFIVKKQNDIEFGFQAFRHVIENENEIHGARSLRQVSFLPI